MKKPELTMKKIVKTERAPEAIGPYSQAVIFENIIYCSGQIALDPKSMQIVGDTVEEQTKQVMKNIEQILLEACSHFGNILKCSIFLASMNDFTSVNEIYSGYFKDQPPARETIEVSTLPKNAKIEISCIAYI